jgi:hypothetical protein
MFADWSDYGLGRLPGGQSGAMVLPTPSTLSSLCNRYLSYD